VARFRATARSDASFPFVWIVEQRAELDAAVSALREIRRAGISRVEIRGRIVWRKEHE